MSKLTDRISFGNAQILLVLKGRISEVVVVVVLDLRVEGGRVSRKVGICGSRFEDGKRVSRRVKIHSGS